MPTRTTHSVVHFTAPFMLTGLDAAQSPGDYAVDHDEEQIDGISWLAYRHVAMLMHLPAIGARSTTRQMLSIDPAELEAALQRDAALNADPRPAL